MDILSICSRPDLMMEWMMNPLKALRYFLYEQYKFCFAKFLVIGVIFAIMGLFFYSMPVSLFFYQLSLRKGSMLLKIVCRHFFLLTWLLLSFNYYLAYKQQLWWTVRMLLNAFLDTPANVFPCFRDTLWRNCSEHEIYKVKYFRECWSRSYLVLKVKLPWKRYGIKRWFKQNVKTTAIE